MPTTTPMSGLDAAFLAAETPTQHLHVLATLVLDTTGVEFGYQVFEDVMAERFRLVEPLRRRLASLPLAAPVWADAPDLDLASHLHHVRVEGGGMEALARVAADVAATPLDRTKPLWEVWLVEGFAPDRAGVIAKVHHAAVDGVSGFEALAAFFDLEPNPASPLWVDTWEPSPPPSIVDLAIEAVKSSASAPVAAARSARRIAAAAASLVRGAGDDTPLPMSGPRLSFNGSLTPRRDVAFSWVGFDDIKSIRRGFDATINDVVLALCAGVLRRYLDDRGELPDRAITAAVPTSERRPEHGASGNRFSAMLTALPVHLAEPEARIDATRRSALAAKDLYATGGTGTLEAVAGMLPLQVIGPIMRVLSGLGVGSLVPPVANVIVSNVRGPEFPLYVRGAQVADIFPMGPLMEGVGLGITVVSYRDRVGIGFLACPDLVPDLAELSRAVPVELAAMAEAARDR